uniref:Uncharacterized protein n=1 Tax=Kalanchoe fedtschenkoi TaxID=63787 RepID=A0A7N0UJB1_KALFE
MEMLTSVVVAELHMIGALGCPCCKYGVARILAFGACSADPSSSGGGFAPPGAGGWGAPSAACCDLSRCFWLIMSANGGCLPVLLISFTVYSRSAPAPELWIVDADIIISCRIQVTLARLAYSASSSSVPNLLFRRLTLARVPLVQQALKAS